MTTRAVAAVDLGASSGRVLLAVLRDERVSLREVARFPNGGVDVDGVFSWNFPALREAVASGLGAAAAEAVAQGTTLASVGVDSWAVDYGLVDDEGALLRLPAHHRDPRTAAPFAETTAAIGGWWLYQRTGIALLPFNTLFQLVADGALAARADQLLLIPDLINYLLCGVRAWERTNASTTQLLTVGREWDIALFRETGVPERLVGGLVDPGTVLGRVIDRAALDAGVPPSTEVISVASHDTASAVVAIPTSSRQCAYISSGTWSLVGVELDKPLVTRTAFEAGYTNELGAFGRTRFLRNIMGFWLLQEVIREYAADGEHYDAATLTAAAATIPRLAFVVDAESQDLLAPGDMRGRLVAACVAGGGRPPTTAAEFTRCILDSLALAYRRAVRGIASVSGVEVETVHIVGGGVLNELLCQLTADACGVPVVAGPVEAAALGNALVQLQAIGALPADLTSLRAVVERSFPTTRYLPRNETETEWASAEARIWAN